MKNLYEGDRGIFVQYVQLALNRAGAKLAIDGIFGADTCLALKEFLNSRFPCIVTDAVWEELLPYLRGYRQSSGAMEEAVILEFPVVPTGVPYSSVLLSIVLDGLKVRYPWIKIQVVGKSVMGTPLYALRLGTGNTEVFYNAAFHANEWITTPVVLKFVEQYASAYTAGEKLLGVSATELYENYTLYVLPMVNPDGVDLVSGVLESGSFYNGAKKIAADYPTIPFPSGWKANIEGIDLNLQFPAGWEIAKRTKFEQGYTSPAPRDYVGEAPLLAPESEAIYRFTMQHDFHLILAYHSQGRVIYWKYLNYNPKGAEEIAHYFGEVSGYEVSETPLASGYAGYKDWFIEEYNRPGYTIEVGEGENPLPLSQFDAIYEDNQFILLGGMTQLE